MPQGIIQVKEQDSVKERSRKINDITKLFEKRIETLERRYNELLERVEDLED